MRINGVYVGILVLLVGMVSIGVASLTNSTRSQIEAAEAMVNLRMVPRTQSITPGDEKTVNVTLQLSDSTSPIRAFALSFQYTPGLSIRSITRPTSIAKQDLPITVFATSAEQPGRMLLYAELASPSASISILTFDIKVAATGLSADPQSITLDYNNAFSGNYPSEVYSDGALATRYSWGSVDDAVFNVAGVTVTPTPVPSGTPSPTTVPTSFPTLTPSATPPLTPVTTIVPTDFISVACGSIAQPVNLWPGGFVVLPQNGLELHWDNVTGAKFYVVEIWEPAAKQPTGTTGTTFSKVFSAPTYTNSFVYSAFKPGVSYIWKVFAVDPCGGSSNISEVKISTTGAQPTDPATAYPTATPTPALPAVNINMRIRLQGIYSQTRATPPTPNVFLVFVRNSDSDEVPVYKWTTMKYDGIGAWVIREPFIMPPGDGYKVWVKPERYLQRKFCDAKPSDSEASWYKCANQNGNITIYPGDNYLDFTNIVMFAGDIPMKGEGDGVIDSSDLSYIVNHFGETANDVADLNFDGITDSQDFGIAVNALRIQRADESYPFKIHPFFRNVPLHPQFP